MKLESVRIQNFRAFEDETVYLNDYTCLVGANGSGKSTILTALNVLFRNSSDVRTNTVVLEAEDFHNRDTSLPITITATFVDLSADAQQDFANYYRQGKLVISASAKWGGGSAPVKQFGQRLVMDAFAPFFRAEGDDAKVDELKKLYGVIKASFPTLPPPGTKAAMMQVLRDFENSNPTLCKLTPSEDEFYGVSKGKNLLEKYVQWIYVPAVKDVTTEQIEARKSALGLLLERTVRTKVSFAAPMETLRQEVAQKYSDILVANESSLVALSDSLRTRLQDWAHPDASVRLRWRADDAKAVILADPLAEVLAGEGNFEGQIARFGHGLQRSLLLALLQELATGDSSNAPTLILACEEPELYQHPPQIRHLATVFENLCNKNAQVLVSSHSPLFVRGKSFEDVRLVRRQGSQQEAKVTAVDTSKLAERLRTATGEKPKALDGVAIKVAQVLQPTLNEMFFTSVVVLVEGLEDAAYLSSYMVLTDQWEEFRRLGCHIVPANGKTSMIPALAVALEAQIPTFVIVDGDVDACDKPERKVRHEKDNRALMRLNSVDDSNPLPDKTLWSNSLVMWSNNIAGALKADIGDAAWIDLQTRTRNEYDLQDVGGLDKNTMFIGYMLSKAWVEGRRFNSLDKLCSAILDYARNERAMKKGSAA